jgi:hypothetical protein
VGGQTGGLRRQDGEKFLKHHVGYSVSFSDFVEVAALAHDCPKINDALLSGSFFS